MKRLIGRHVHPGELVHQLVPLLEADHGAHQPNHPSERWRQRRVEQTQRSVTRAETRLAAVAVVVGPPERHLAQCGLEALLAATGVAGWLVAGDARQGRTGVVTVVRVEALGDGAGCHGQGPAPGGGLDGLEIPRVGDARA